MFGFRDHPIRKKIVALNMLVTASALLLSGAAFFVYFLFTYRSNMVNYVSSQAAIAGYNSVSALVFNDVHSAESTLSAFRASPRIRYAAIYDANGHPFAGYWHDSHEQFRPLPEIPPGQTEVSAFHHDELALAQVVEFEGKRVGFVYIVSDLQTLTRRLHSYEGILASVLLLSFLAALLVSLPFQRSISEPLGQLAETARIVSRDRNYALRATPTGSQDEVATLIAAFNDMLEQIHQRDIALQRSHDTLENRVKERTAELSKAQNSLQALSRRLLQMQDEERRRIARELHEGSGQVLAALSMNLSLLQSKAARDPEIRKIVDDSTRMVADILKDLRTLSYLLHPPLLEETGLESALRWLVEGFAQRSGIRMDLQIAHKLERLPKDVEIAAFRIVQESLTNVHRHSGSSDASVYVDRSEHQLIVEVRDGGVGIGADSNLTGSPRAGVGIQGMRERVQHLGGRLEVQSEAGRGTLVRAILPLPSPSAGDQDLPPPEAS
jgi:signal transduction histidine kinase